MGSVFSAKWSLMFILVKCYRISKWMMFSNNVSSLCPKHVLQLLFQLPHASGPTAQGQDVKASLKCFLRGRGKTRTENDDAFRTATSSAPHISLLTLLDFMTVCLSLRGLPPIAPIIRFCDHTEQQQKGKRMLGWVNIISTESLETLKILIQGEWPLIWGWHRTPLWFFLSTLAYEATDSAASFSNSKCCVMSLTSPEPLSPPLPIIRATV